MKRYRAPNAKPGELKAQWGKLRHENPDLCFAWGDGVSKRDVNLLHSMFSGKRARLAIGEEREKSGGFPVVYDPSFLEELEARGYDITTLRFSVQKKRPPAADSVRDAMDGTRKG